MKFKSLNNAKIYLFDKILETFLYCWEKETSYGNLGEDGSPQSQCNITAYTINKIFGGNIIKISQPFKNVKSHFVNFINGNVVDFTYKQFDDKKLNPTFRCQISTPDECISFIKNVNVDDFVKKFMEQLEK